MSELFYGQYKLFSVTMYYCTLLFLLLQSTLDCLLINISCAYTHRVITFCNISFQPCIIQHDPVFQKVVILKK